MYPQFNARYSSTSPNNALPLSQVGGMPAPIPLAPPRHYRPQTISYPTPSHQPEVPSRPVTPLKSATRSNKRKVEADRVGGRSGYVGRTSYIDKDLSRRSRSPRRRESRQPRERQPLPPINQPVHQDKSQKHTIRRSVRFSTLDQAAVFCSSDLQPPPVAQACLLAMPQSQTRSHAPPSTHSTSRISQLFPLATTRRLLRLHRNSHELQYIPRRPNHMPPLPIPTTWRWTGPPPAREARSHYRPRTPSPTRRRASRR